ncbi:MAG: TIGR04283 family arsenosugar biosynthesis glycosyltransferase [Rhodospirillales bacterium]|nr:TIGR04283 family arsenosugar biosynthesis glycosyltransferase [Rhodospirillales bacterium]MDH3910769.1 TIGR04283 family arsenosugar biosynthesis glycosyltransferase [Rhodospirillales bacterium]MDH3916565.1 TIGR04283 family arsenosugar biosynthesis glycosyltransferase [Rhodospirillales bacterium]
MGKTTRQPPLSIVIPALDGAATLPATLAALEEGRRAGLIAEVILVDGVSSDSTVGIAAGAGARIVDAGAPGRGRQLFVGGAAARGEWLLFLHADTSLAPGWAQAVARVLSDPAMAERAGHFRLRLDDPARQARLIERLANWRARRLGLPYGDQGLLIARDFYERLGGFRPLPLMEDVELVRRIGRRRLVALDGAAVTSAARYRRDGWWARPLRNLTLLTLYFLGLPPGWLRRLYG